MKRLKNEIFLLSFTILTVCLISMITIFFCQNYNQEKHNIFNALKSADGMMHRVNMNPDSKREPKLDDDAEDLMEKKDNRMIFMDSTIYTILLDEQDTILDIVNHSQNSMDNKKVETLAAEILKEKKVNHKIGFLLVDKYSYRYRKGNSLIILDNTKVTNRLNLNLLTYIFIYD